MTESQHEDLLAATQRLTGRVDQLSRSLQTSEKQSQRTKLLMVVVTVLSMLSLMGVVIIVSLFNQIHATVDANQHDQITNCQNNNESREASRVLWSFVIDQSEGNPATTQEKQKQLEAYRAWINELYQSHDCSDLGRKYPIPAPPSITPAA